MSTGVYQSLRDTGTLPGVRVRAENEVHGDVDEQENIVQVVQPSPRAGTRSTARCLDIPRTRVETTASREHALNLVPGDIFQRLEFCW